MNESVSQVQAGPAVSIILPTYNRAKFLPQAFASIRSQQFTDWELIIVDDGSTDNTRDLVVELTQGWPQSVRYVHQENQGAYGARNTGLDLATGQYIAFFDSDDVWLPHHLQDCVAALEANPEVDWVYGACRIVELSSGSILAENTFYIEDKRRPFLYLSTCQRGSLCVIEDPRAACILVSNGFQCGLQNSAIHQRVFEKIRFRTAYRNEAEDILFAIRCLTGGCKFGYLDQIHVIYCVHDHNSSAASTGKRVEQQISLFKGLLRGFEDLIHEQVLGKSETRALKCRLSHVYFWDYGYAVLLLSGRKQEAVCAFRRGLQLWPWALGYWKAYIISRVRLKLFG